MEKRFIRVDDVWQKGAAIPDILSAVEEKGIYYFGWLVWSAQEERSCQLPKRG